MPYRAAIHTLGCRLNQAEEALMADDLVRHGYTIVSWGEAAELVVINSCAVTVAAAQKTRQAVHAARRRWPEAFVVVAGCGATVESGSWAAPGLVDLLVPSPAKTRLSQVLPPELTRRAGAAPRQASGPGPGEEAFSEPGTGLYLARTRANLKIQDGCDFGCSYCIVPMARGRPRSRDWDDTRREAAELIRRGHREIVLTGVNLATYRDQGHRLDDLLRDLLALPGEFRLRLSSLEPTPLAWAVIDLMACQPRLCRFLHLPLQYGEDSLLRAMNRRYSVAEYEQLAQAAVARVPGLCLGSDVIVGFPGETEARFDACCEAVDRLPLAYLHVFTYSPRPGTEACGLPGRVHGTVAARRHRVLAELGRAKSDAFAATMVGQTVQVLVESEDESDSVEGCSDNYLRVRLPGARGRVSRRQLVQARITRRCDGRLVEGVLA